MFETGLSCKASRKVSDAAMSIPGLRIQHGLPISAMPLIWGMAEPNRLLIRLVLFLLIVRGPRAEGLQ